MAFEPSVGIYTSMLMAAVCALAAAAVTLAPWTAIVGTLASVFGPLAFATDIGDNEPGFPAMLIVLGIMAAPAIPAALIGNRLAIELHQGR